MGASDMLLGGNPVMDKHPFQGGITILIGMLHAKETGISSGRSGLSLMCTFYCIDLLSIKNIAWFSLSLPGSTLMKQLITHF